MKKIIVMTLLVSGLSMFMNAQSDKSKGNSGKKSSSGSIEASEALPNTFHKGQLDFNIGVGFGRGRYYYRGFNSSYRYTVTPPISLSLDYGITKNVSIGGLFAFTKAKLTYDGNNWHSNNGYYDYRDTYSWSYYIVGVRAAFHFSEYIKVENLDLYGGIMLGNNFAVYKYTTTDPYYNHNSGTYSSQGGFIWGLYAGGRYMFTEKIGVFGEFGYGLTYGNVGLNIKL